LTATFDIATDVDATDWQLNFCPIAGPRMARSGDSLITVWMSGASGTGRVYLRTIHSGTMQTGLQLDFPTPSAPQTAQSQADVAAVQDTVGIVFVEKSREIVFHFSTIGAAGLADESTRLAVPDHILHLPSLAFGNGVFHLVYADATAGQVLYKQGVLAGSSPVNEAIEALDISAFPNPVIAGGFLVKSAAYELQEVSMFDFFGKKILGQKTSGLETIVPTVNLPKGIYFLTIKTLQGEVSREIIVK
jgi:Secretion system C-terminal sorting domain